MDVNLFKQFFTVSKYCRRVDKNSEELNSLEDINFSSLWLYIFLHFTSNHILTSTLSNYLK